MNFKILTVSYSPWGGFDEDSGEDAPFYAPRKGYYIRAECIEDRQKICIFIPENKVKEPIKTQKGVVQ